MTDSNYTYAAGVNPDETITGVVMERGKRVEKTLPRYDRIDDQGTLFDLKDRRRIYPVQTESSTVEEDENQRWWRGQSSPLAVASDGQAIVDPL